MRLCVLFLLAALLWAGSWSLAWAEDVVVVPHPTRVRLSGEVVELAGGEQMGLAGLGYDALAPFPWLPGAWAGLSGYGAAGGDRGGLFTLGVTLGWRARIVGPFGVEVGGYAGGGGGASAGQGDGLHLRGHAALTAQFAQAEIAVGVVHNRFHGGTIEDTGLGIALHFSDTLSVLGLGTAAPATVDTRSWTVAPLVSLYFTADETGRSGNPLADSISLVGIGLERHLGAGWRLPVRMAGAARGATGYMEVFSGLGWVGAGLIAPEFFLLAGAGGGGDVDTGGGILLRPEIGLGVGLGDSLHLRAAAGYTWAIDGDFSAPGATLALAWSSTEWVQLGAGPGTLAASALQADPWRITIGGSRYFPRAGRDQGVSLISVLVDKPLLPWLVLTGRARSALSDQAGGYSEGLLGARVDWPLLAQHTLGLSGEIGAGGGGGIPTGTGAIAAVMGHWRWMPLPRWGMQIGVGRLLALDGDLVTDIIEAGVVWSFARPLVR